MPEASMLRWALALSAALVVGCETAPPAAPSEPTPSTSTAPAPPPGPAVSVIDGHAWTAGMEALAQRLLGVARAGQVTVQRTEDNRLQVRATGDSAFEKVPR